MRHAPPAGLPPLDQDALAHAGATQEFLVRQVRASGDHGFMPFDQWMELALYAPAHGYYAAGSAKLAGAVPEGDFTTAPELTPVFGEVLARQVAQILHAAESDTVLEFGAGSGALAAVLVPALQDLGIAVQYRILELSPDLRARQQERLSSLGGRVRWLDSLPDGFVGCVLANEVLDAMPVTLFQWSEDGTLDELGVVVDEKAGPGSESPFHFAARPAPRELQALVAARMPPLPGYRSEINVRAEAWMAEMGRWLHRGAALIIDYGFPQSEYYHPQRSRGTLMCHFRHHAHDQPLILAGLQDITAHVDFTAMAEAAHTAGLDVMGYTSQARFLMNAGLAEVIGRFGTASALERARAMGPVQQLVSEAEMGELFKVLAVGRDLDEPLIGFVSGDRRHSL